MAGVEILSSLTIEDNEYRLAVIDEDDYLAREVARTPDSSKNVFRPGISDETSVGFFRSDHANQTDVTEIIPLNEVMKSVQHLQKESTDMNRTISFIKSSMLADFEAKLKQKSVDLYVRLNDKVSTLEKQHAERVDTIRRAFRQQLSDALIQIHAYYASDVTQRLNSHEMQNLTAAKRVQELENVVKAKDVTIQELLDKVAYLEHSRSARSPEHRGSTHIEVDQQSSTEEVQELKDEIEQLETKIAQLESDASSANDFIKELQRQLEQSQRETEKAKREVDVLKKSKESLIAAMQSHHAASSKALESQKQALDKEREEALRKAKAELEEANRRKASDPELKSTPPRVVEIQSTGIDRQQHSRLMQEKKALEDELARVRAEVEAKEKTIVDMKQSRDMHAYLKDQVNRLKSELANVEKNWQKKFAILQKSMFALKDECYVRQTMMRQAATLHQATVSYAYDGPLATKVEDRRSPSRSRKILPAIIRPRTVPNDFLSYTVTPPPGDDKTLTSVDANQVLSDDEDLPTDVLPLPPPPPGIGMATVKVI